MVVLYSATGLNAPRQKQTRRGRQLLCCAAPAGAAIYGAVVNQVSESSFSTAVKASLGRVTLPSLSIFSLFLIILKQCSNAIVLPSSYYLLLFGIPSDQFQVCSCRYAGCVLQFSFVYKNPLNCWQVSHCFSCILKIIHCIRNFIIQHFQIIHFPVFIHSSIINTSLHLNLFHSS